MHAAGNIDSGQPLNVVVQDYFSQLNPLAKRITNDIFDTKLSYGQLWNTLNSSQQNDVINETLICPQIALKYFDSLVSLSSTSSSLSSPKNTSLLESPRLGKTSVAKNQSQQLFKDKELNEYVKNNDSYSYDGRNLISFAIQKVALKVLQYEVIGEEFRDEHSTPFSYRTKSQINLHIFKNKDQHFSQSSKDKKQNEISLISFTPSEKYDLKNIITKKSSNKTIYNYKKLQTELKIKLDKNIFYNKCLPILNKTDMPQDKHLKANSVDFRKKLQSITTTNYIESTSNAPTPSFNYAVCADIYTLNRESSNLMQNSSSKSVLIITSDDDDAESIDDKNVCEDVKLLDNDHLERDFDFLNNW